MNKYQGGGGGVEKLFSLLLEIERIKDSFKTMRFSGLSDCCNKGQLLFTEQIYQGMQ